MLEIIQEKNKEEKEKNEQEFKGGRIEEWNKENEINNLQNLYNKL